MIQTDRMLLRRPVIEDARAHFRIHGDPATNIHNPAGPVRDEDESARILEEWMAHWDRTGFGYWAVALREKPSAVIGFGGINQKVLAERMRLNLYFRFSPSAWGRGLATELGRAALSTAGADEVFALVRPENAPSIRVIQKLGMNLVGSVDDVVGFPPSLLFASTSGVKAS
jgi:RimJ/RimL family protein N-acetyltransferase